MIVRHTAGLLHLITQPDHAALARRVMEHWRSLDHHPRRASVLLAIGEHDNGWQEPDSAPTIDPATGRVHDFINAPIAVRQDVWPRAVERLSHDPWAAALVAEHAVTVYGRFRQDAEWDRFFSEMEAMRDRLIATATQSSQQLEEDYPFVRIGDLISLVFCNQWQQETYRDWMFRLDGDRVLVTPDLSDGASAKADGFGGADVPIEITAIELDDRPFASDAELRNAMQRAPRISLRGVVRQVQQPALFTNGSDAEPSPRRP
jgi:hypothetical protein